MVTSLTYNFADISADSVIADAFAQIGRSNAMISGWQYKMGRESLNFLLSSWISKKGLNLFTVEQDIIQIIPGQYTYRLAKNTSKILECTLAKANQIIVPGSVTYASNSGNTSTVFTSNPTTVCDAGASVNGVNPYIGITFPTPQPIQYVGILLPNNSVPLLLKLSIQSSTELSQPIVGETPPTWVTNLDIPEQLYYPNQTAWFSLPFTQTAKNWQIVETGGNELILQQILLDIPYQSQKMSRLGRDSYTFNPVNNTQGVSSTYYVDRNLQPTLNLFQTPSNNGWQFFVYNRVRSIQDVGEYTNSLDLTPRFLEAATVGLAARLARLYATDRADSLQTASDALFLQAAMEDTENVDMNLGISSGFMGN